MEEWKEKPAYKPVERYSFWKGKQTEVENDLTLRKDFIPLRTDVGHAVSGGGPWVRACYSSLETQVIEPPPPSLLDLS